MEKIYVTRSDAYRESAPLFRAERVRILDDETTRRELRNLELRADRVTAGPGHDDRANSLCLAICMAIQVLCRGALFPDEPGLQRAPPQGRPRRQPLGEDSDR